MCQGVSRMYISNTIQETITNKLYYNQDCLIRKQTCHEQTREHQQCQVYTQMQIHFSRQLIVVALSYKRTISLRIQQNVEDTNKQIVAYVTLRNCYGKGCISFLLVRHQFAYIVSEI